MALDEEGLSNRSLVARTNLGGPSSGNSPQYGLAFCLSREGVIGNVRPLLNVFHISLRRRRVRRTPLSKTRYGTIYQVTEGFHLGFRDWYAIILLVCSIIIRICERYALY